MTPVKETLIAAPPVKDTVVSGDGELFDKRGIPFERGDIVKVFHFIGPRNKREYMYKQVLECREIGPSKNLYLEFSHLNFVEDYKKPDGPYLEILDGRVLTGYEIVQSIDCHHDERPRAALTASKSGEKNA